MAAVFAVIITLLGLYLLAQALWLFVLLRYPEPEYADEVHTFTTIDRWRIQLRRCLPKGGGPREPVLLVHSAAANHLNFMIPGGRSIVDSLTDAGYDCWTVDLRGARNSVPPHGANRKRPEFEAYLDFDIPAAIEFIRRKTGYEEVHWVGHSMGALILHAYALKSALREEPDGVRCAVTLGGPPGFRFRHPSIAWLLPLVHGFHKQIDAVTRMLLPLLRRYHIGLYGFPMNWDNVDMRVTPAELTHAFQYAPPRVLSTLERWAATGDWSIMNGSFSVDDNIDAFEIPLLAIYGVLDPFAKPEDGREFLDRMPMEDKRMLVLGKEHGCENDYSHVDLAFSKNGPEEVHAPIIEWLRAHPMESDVETAGAAGGEAKTAAEAGPASPPSKRKKTPAKKKSPVKKKTKTKSASKKQGAAKTASKKKSVPKKKTASKKKAPTKKKPAAKAKASSPAAETPPEPSRAEQGNRTRKTKPAAEKKAPVRKKKNATGTAAKPAAKKKPPVRRTSVAKKKPAAKRKPTADDAGASASGSTGPADDSAEAVRGSLSALPQDVLQSLRTDENQPASGERREDSDGNESEGAS